VSLTEAELQQITEIIDDRLADLATGQQMAVGLIRETLTHLEQCQARLTAVTADLQRAQHHETDAVTALGLYRDAVQQLQQQRNRDEELATAQRQQIKALERRVFELERQVNGHE